MRLYHAILRGAALLVSGEQRGEWLAEWKSELWYVRRTCGRKPRAVTAFCLGAFKDALWLRRNGPSPNAREAFRLESPLQCCLFLAVLLAVTLFFSWRMPGPRERILPSLYGDSRDLVMISHGGRSAAPFPTIPIEDYRSLTNRVQTLFIGFAFYRPILTRVQGARRPADLSIALASGNLFELMNVPVSRQKTAALILSDTAWRKYFDGDPHIVGRVLEVAGLEARVAAIIAEDSWRLPGRMDGWLLDAALPPHSKGFVLGRLRTSALHHAANYDGFDCVPLADGQPALAFLFVVIVACLILPATTSLSLGEYPADRYSPGWIIRFRRWMFLAIKIAFILPIVYGASFDLTYLISPGIQAHAMLWGCVFGFRWALIDQRRRCPVCLRFLANPTRIGRPSQNLLGWYGTELICERGHGLLHVPEIPTSWSGTQRWHYLDPSWRSLFSS